MIARANYYYMRIETDITVLESPRELQASSVVDKLQPHLLLWRMCQHSCNKDPMGDQFKPGIYKARSFSRPQDVECIAERKISEAQM